LEKPKKVYQRLPGLGLSRNGPQEEKYILTLRSPAFSYHALTWDYQDFPHFPMTKMTFRSLKKTVVIQSRPKITGKEFWTT